MKAGPICSSRASAKVAAAAMLRFGTLSSPMLLFHCTFCNSRNSAIFIQCALPSHGCQSAQCTFDSSACGAFPSPALSAQWLSAAYLALAGGDHVQDLPQLLAFLGLRLGKQPIGVFHLVAAGRRLHRLTIAEELRVVNRAPVLAWRAGLEKRRFIDALADHDPAPRFVPSERVHTIHTAARFGPQASPATAPGLR